MARHDCCLPACAIGCHADDWFITPRRKPALDGVPSPLPCGERRGGRRLTGALAILIARLATRPTCNRRRASRAGRVAVRDRAGGVGSRQDLAVVQWRLNDANSDVQVELVQFGTKRACQGQRGHRALLTITGTSYMGLEQRYACTSLRIAQLGERPDTRTKTMG